MPSTRTSAPAASRRQTLSALLAIAGGAAGAGAPRSAAGQAAQPAQAGPATRFGPLRLFAGRRNGPGELDSPSGVARDGQGNVYVADFDNHRVVRFAADGTPLAHWGGEPGSRAGAFISPLAVAVDAAGSLYVADAGNRRVQKLSPDGAVQAVWDGAGGAGRGSLGEPAALAVDRDGAVYVADRAGGRVLRLGHDGSVLSAWHESASGPIARPLGVTLDARGHIYVADGERHCVRKLLPDGTEIACWGEYGGRLGAFDTPSGIAVDRQGNLYVADNGNDRVQKLTSTGISLAGWEHLPLPRGQEDDRAGSEESAYLLRPQDVAASTAGALLVVDRGHHRVVALDPLGRLLQTWGEGSGGDTDSGAGAGGGRQGRLAAPRDVVVGADGVVSIADTDRERVLRFAPDGRPLGEWRLPEEVDEDGESYTPVPLGLAADGEGGLYVTEIAGSLLYRLSPVGMVAARWDLSGETRDETISPTRLSVAGDGSLYMLDGSSHVQHLSASGERLGSWGGRGGEPGQLRGAEDIAVGPDGTVYVLDAGNSRVQRFSPDGALLAVWGSAGTAPGRLDGPRGLATDATGNLLVTDGGVLGRVQRFTPDGQALEGIHLGSGEANGLANLRGIAAAPNGRIYVADTGTGRLYSIG
jgi:tripartite motif-containing protein 71